MLNKMDKVEAETGESNDKQHLTEHPPLGSCDLRDRPGTGQILSGSSAYMRLQRKDSRMYSTHTARPWAREYGKMFSYYAEHTRGNQLMLRCGAGDAMTKQASAPIS